MDEIIKAIVQQGGHWGVLTALLLVVCWYLFKMVLKMKDERLDAIIRAKEEAMQNLQKAKDAMQKALETEDRTDKLIDRLLGAIEKLAQLKGRR